MYEKKIPKIFECGMAIIMEIMGGKWKAYLIYSIDKGKRRPSELHRAIPLATPRVLNQQLRELEEYGILSRVIYKELPLKVEYYLTEFGESLLPVITAMEQWGDQYGEIFKQFINKKKERSLT